MSELIALVSTTVSITLQIKGWIEQISYNQDTRLLLVDRITSALTQLQTESRKISRSSPDLIRSVQKLKSNLHRVLQQCQKKHKSRSSAFGAKLREWIDKDTITSALRAVETQISYCFQEFGALGTVRIERKLGDHNVQVNRKLDELLRRNPPRAVRQTRAAGSRNAPPRVPIKLQAQASGSSTTTIGDNALDNAGLHKSIKKELKFSLPAPVRTKSYTSTSTASMSDRSFITYGPSSPPVTMISKQSTPKAAAHQSVPRSTYFVRTAKSEASITSSHATPTDEDLTDADSLCVLQANKLDSECKRLRSLKHFSEGLIPGRKAVALRRMVYATEKNVTTTAAFARSLTYLARCLKDIHVDSHLTGTRVGAELAAVLSESVELYKEAFKEDKACRIDLATALYNLSVRQSEPVSQNTKRLNKRSNKLPPNLVAALISAGEAVHHFTILEREDPNAYGMDLAHALLNLSFILSDTGKDEKALTTSRKAVMLAYRFTSTDPHTEERARNIRALHKALMRVSSCLDNLGRIEEAHEAEMEANDVLKKPFFTS